MQLLEVPLMKATTKRSSSSQPVRRYALYGEAPRRVDEHLVCIQAIHDWSRQNWFVRPHVHDNLCHIMFFDPGKGKLITDSLTARIEGQCLAIVPSRVAHSFEFDPISSGFALTIADTFIRDLSRSEPALEQLFIRPSLLSLNTNSKSARTIGSCLKHLSSESAGTKPGHRAAIESFLLMLLVIALRINTAALSDSVISRGPDAELMTSFRELIEAMFHTNACLSDYAEKLKVSPSRLRKVCVRLLRKSPLQLIHDRVFLESKRLLLYTSATVSEVGYAAGFEDPAYFCRFFTHREGESPTAFRKRRASA